MTTTTEREGRGMHYEVVKPFTVDHKAAQGGRPKSVDHHAGARVAADAIPKQSIPWLLEQGALRALPSEPTSSQSTGRPGRRASGSGAATSEE